MNARTHGLARPFARQEMLEEGETLKRSETIGPFVVALVALPARRIRKPRGPARRHRAGTPQ